MRTTSRPDSSSRSIARYMIESVVFSVCITPLGSPVAPEVKTTSWTALTAVPAGAPPRPGGDPASAANGVVPAGPSPRTTKTCSRRGSSGRSAASMPACSKPRKAAGTTATWVSRRPSMNLSSLAR